jgi:hypothetical protein
VSRYRSAVRYDERCVDVRHVRDCECVAELGAAPAPGVADWMKSEAWLANVGHVLAGYAVILTAWAFTHTTLYLLDTWGALVAYAILKEYVFDLRYESGETVLSSTIDFVGYIGGAGLGTLVVELARAFAH